MPVAVPRTEVAVAALPTQPDRSERVRVQDWRSTMRPDDTSDSEEEEHGGNESGNDNDSSEEDFSGNDETTEHSTQSDDDPYEQNFVYSEDLNIGTGSCRHPPNVARPCKYCRAAVSRVLYENVREIFTRLFVLPRLKKAESGFMPRDPLLVRSFKSIHAMHDVGYLQRVLAEVLNWIVFSLDRPLGRVDMSGQSDLLWLHDMANRLYERVRTGGRYDEFVLVRSFRNQLNAVGVAGGSENTNPNWLVECHR